MVVDYKHIDILDLQDQLSFCNMKNVNVVFMENLKREVLFAGTKRLIRIVLFVIAISILRYTYGIHSPATPT